VSLLAGPAFALGAGVGTLCAAVPWRGRVAATAAVLGAAAVGRYDDLGELGGPPAKGLGGHLAGLRRGRITTGTVKLVALPVVGFGVARAVSARPVDLVVGAALVAGHANLANLFDLRPGRCLKFGLLLAPLAPAAVGAVGAAAALLPADLRERVMLGDCGANAVGAALGSAVLLRHRLPGRLAHLVAVVALTLASERHSFSEVIAANPALRRIDDLGRLPRTDVTVHATFGVHRRTLVHR
jgi:UDP-N-acetylmuramyl pentapeptide phosphotransferase/UDP-N-acetylglucosamine-1-phosphate transferase